MKAWMLLLLCGPAWAQTAERPAVQVGDQWQFVMYWGMPSKEPNRVWVVDAVTPSGIDGRENGEPLRLTRELGVVDSPRARESNPQSLQFPLEVGKRWQYTSDWLFKPKNSQGRSVVDVAVLAYEKVGTPAGEFDAFRLTARYSMKGVSGIGSIIDADAESTYWYAPAARAVVKSVSRNPYLGTSTVELVKLDLRP